MPVCPWGYEHGGEQRLVKWFWWETVLVACKPNTAPVRAEQAAIPE